MGQPRNPIPGGNPEIARLSEMVIALLGEVTVLTERLDTVERLLEEKSLIARELIEAFVPDTKAQSERDAKRGKLIAAVLRPLRNAAILQAGEAR